MITFMFFISETILSLLLQDDSDDWQSSGSVRLTQLTKWCVKMKSYVRTRSGFSISVSNAFSLSRDA